MIFLLLFSGFLLCKGTACPLKMTPSRVVVRYGDALYANCTSTSEVEGIGWESTYGGTGLEERPFSLLEIERVNDWVIEPKCYINYLNGDQCTEDLPVTVYKTPESVTVSPPEDKINPMIAGQVYRLHCDVVLVAPVNNLNVYWYKGNKRVNTEDFKDSRPTPQNKSNFYEFTAEREDNGKQIWCEAQLKFEPEQLSLSPTKSNPQNIIVLYPPFFSNAVHETVELRSGEASRLDCTATGNPAPVHSWDFPELFQETIKGENLTGAVLTSTFLIQGNYSCTAFNSQGQTTKYFTVVEASEDRTTFAAIIGVFATLGVLLMIAGPFIVTANDTRRGIKHDINAVVNYYAKLEE